MLAVDQYSMCLRSAECDVSPLDGHNHRSESKILNDADLGPGDEAQSRHAADELVAAIQMVDSPALAGGQCTQRKLVTTGPVVVGCLTCAC